jgi:hypothetical protein
MDLNTSRHLVPAAWLLEMVPKRQVPGAIVSGNLKSEHGLGLLDVPTARLRLSLKS